MNIGPIKLKNKTVFAPLAGISDLPLRLMAKKAGCALVYSEMISSHGLVYKSPKTGRLLESCPQERPLAVQLFGSDPAIMAEAAAMVQSFGADIVDINFGCSVRKILKSGSGAALMKTPDKAEMLLKATRKAIDIPLSIKIRSGWDYSGDQAIKIAKIAQDCGVDCIAIHPRTATQGFGGRADWSLIKTLKETVCLPIIGNGDVITSSDAIRLQRQTNCDAIMVGRGAIGNPLLFSQIIARLEDRPEPCIKIKDRYKMMLDYLDAIMKYYGEKAACYLIRSRLCWFVKGLPLSSNFRISIRKVSSQAEALFKIKEYFNTLDNDNKEP